MALVLNDMLGTFERVFPGSVRVLRLAASMRSDIFFWERLELLARDEIPELFAPTKSHPRGSWSQLRRFLEGSGILIEDRYATGGSRMYRHMVEYLMRSRGEVLGDS